MSARPLVLLALPLALAGCKSERNVRPVQGPPPETGETTTTGAPYTVTNLTAIERIVQARCNREQECAERGHEPTDPTRCAAEQRRAIESGLSSGECPGGISAEALDACIEAIQNERCGVAHDALTVASCRTQELCRPAAAAERRQ